MAKRYGPEWGSLNCRARDHHAGYGSLPESIRRHPKLCSLRDLASWYCSAFLFYTHVMKDTLLDRAIRLLVDGEECVRNENARALLMRHRTEFRERLEGEAVRDAAPRAPRSVRRPPAACMSQGLATESSVRRRHRVP